MKRKRMTREELIAWRAEGERIQRRLRERMRLIEAELSLSRKKTG